MSPAIEPATPVIVDSPASLASTLPSVKGAVSSEHKIRSKEEMDDASSNHESSRIHMTSTMVTNEWGQGHEEDKEASEEEDESGEDENDEDEDDEDEDEEPTLKYERLSGDADLIFRRDSASAMAIANKRFAVGTHAGIVHILDTSGARIKSFKPHSATVVDVCMDETADYFATASLDGEHLPE